MHRHDGVSAKVNNSRSRSLNWHLDLTESVPKLFSHGYWHPEAFENFSSSHDIVSSCCCYGVKERQLSICISLKHTYLQELLVIVIISWKQHTFVCSGNACVQLAMFVFTAQKCGFFFTIFVYLFNRNYFHNNYLFCSFIQVKYLFHCIYFHLLFPLSDDTIEVTAYMIFCCCCWIFNLTLWFWKRPIRWLRPRHLVIT